MALNMKISDAAANAAADAVVDLLNSGNIFECHFRLQCRR